MFYYYNIFLVKIIDESNNNRILQKIKNALQKIETIWKYLFRSKKDGSPLYFVDKDL